MDDRNRDDDDPRRGYIFRSVFRRLMWALRYFVVKYCSCRCLVSLFIIISSLTFVRMGGHDPDSTRSNNDVQRNNTDSLTNLADFEGGTLVRKRNSNNAETVARLLDGDTENLLCDSVNITTMMGILDDGTPRECVHGDGAAAAAGSNSKCLQCATERFKEICEQQARELEAYNRLYNIQLVPDERTCLLSQESEDACNSINSENLQLPDNGSFGNFESGATGVSKPSKDKVCASQNNTWLDVSVVSPDSFDGLYVNEVTIRGLDYNMDTFDDFPYLDDIEFEINDPYLQAVERAANAYNQNQPQAAASTSHSLTGAVDQAASHQNLELQAAASTSQSMIGGLGWASSHQNLELEAAASTSRSLIGDLGWASSHQNLELPATASTSHSMTGVGGSRIPEDPVQTYHEVLSRIRSLINLPYRDQCSNSSFSGNFESQPGIQYETECPAPGIGARPKRRNAISPAMPQEAPAMPQEAPAMPQEAPAMPQEAPAMPSAMPREAPAMPREAPAMPREAPAMPREAPAMPREAPAMPREAPAMPREAPAMLREASAMLGEASAMPRDAPIMPREAPIMPREASRMWWQAPIQRQQTPIMQRHATAREKGQEESPSRATGAIPKNWEAIRKMQGDAESGRQSKSQKAHSSLSLSASSSRNTDTVITNPYAGVLSRNLDVIQPRNDRQSWTSELNNWSFEMPLFSRVTDHEIATSRGQRSCYTGNILRAASDLDPRLILVADEAINDDDDEMVVEYSGEILDTDDTAIGDEGKAIETDTDAVIEGIGEITFSDENETLV